MKPLQLLGLSGALLSAGVLLAARPQSARPTKASKARIARLSGKSVGGTVAVAPVPGARLTVVALTSTTCPLGLKYGPALARLEDAYAAKGVRFVWVNPEPDATPADIRAAAKRLGFEGPVVRDAAWAHRLGAKTTTETFVLDPKGNVRYRGAVDDQYAIGAALPKARNRYLVDALDSLLAGRDPKVRATSAPGCVLAPRPRPIPAVPAYYGRIEGIVQKNCLPCHREGGPAPFRLDSFAAVKARAPMIAYVVKEGIMPPWFAAKDTGPWRNDRTLLQADKDALIAWANEGTPKGDPKRAQKAPEFVPGWTIGKPDTVFQIPAPVKVQAEGIMSYVNVDVPTSFAEDKWAKSIEIVPTARRVVHHVLVFVRVPGANGPTEDRDGLGGFFAGYVPGQSALKYGPAFAKRLPKGATLRFQMHYTPNGTATEDRTKVGVIWGEKPESEVLTVGLSNLFMSIPAGAENHRVAAEIISPVDAEILSFLPHMHVRGKAAKYEVARKEGDKTVRETLLDVPKYDFNWQLNYVAATPMKVKRGERLIYTAWYDNSERNPANPDPKVRVGWGEQTFDEMHLGYIEFFVPGVRP